VARLIAKLLVLDGVEYRAGSRSDSTVYDTILLCDGAETPPPPPDDPKTTAVCLWFPQRVLSEGGGKCGLWPQAAGEGGEAETSGDKAEERRNDQEANRSPHTTNNKKIDT